MLFDRFDAIQSEIENLLKEADPEEQEIKCTQFKVIYFQLVSHARNKLGRTTGTCAQGRSSPQTFFERRTAVRC